MRNHRLRRLDVVVRARCSPLNSEDAGRRRAWRGCTRTVRPRPTAIRDHAGRVVGVVLFPYSEKLAKWRLLVRQVIFDSDMENSWADRRAASRIQSRHVQCFVGELMPRGTLVFLPDYRPSETHERRSAGEEKSKHNQW